MKKPTSPGTWARRNGYGWSEARTSSTTSPSCPRATDPSPSRWRPAASGGTAIASPNICTLYHDHLSNSVEHTVDGPRQLTVSDARAAEGTDSTMTFTVRLSQRASEQVTVTWQTQDMTALSTSDYEYDMGALTFEPGETRKTITVGIRDDSLAEGDEQLRVVLRNADGAVIGDGLGIGTITDDE